MKDYLLVFNKIGVNDPISIYHIPYDFHSIGNDIIIKTLEDCHEKYINVHNDKCLDSLRCMIGDICKDDTEENKLLNGILEQYLVYRKNNDPFFEEEISTSDLIAWSSNIKIIISGFVC
jgi:hypothetical protein